MRPFLISGAVFAMSLAAQTSPPIDIGLSVNGMPAAVVSRGWPMVIWAAVVSTGGPLNLGAGGAPWTQALRVKVVDASGRALTWPLQAVPASSDTLALGPLQSGHTYWLVAPEFVQTLVNGTYEISVSLDMGGGVSVESPVDTVQIQAEPATLSPEDETMKYLLLSQYARLTGDGAAAMGYLDTILAKYPDMMQPWCDKATLLEAAGDFDGAIAAVQKAQDIFDARFDGVESPPPTLLDRRMTRLLQKRAAQSTAAKRGTRK